MENILRPFNVKQITDNTFKLLDDDWMLITAGNKAKFNTMTASWGAFGILWNKPIAICFVRPQRYTFGFINNAEYFTLSFFSQKYHSELSFLGSTSGRKINKVEQSKLTPAFTKNESAYFTEARLVLECRKIYTHDLNPDNFLHQSFIDEIYPNSDFHKMFIGEIVNCFSSDIVAEKPRAISEEEDNL